MSSYTSANERPTLPPLHTLNLLPPTYRRYDSLCAGRRASSCTSSSRTPSPTPSDLSSSSSSSASSSPLSAYARGKLTLVPSSFADADAVVVVPPPSAADAKHGKPLLLTGAALAHLRHPQRQIARGTRLHPYRFARRGSGSGTPV
ncbi:hypothetical protein B0H17DRAFT_1202291 [Mycena rosella]|uniref:Uncharacterized protein n=1 Tax=Mycena rosella TaxID=1033263 RepID=A0AAD7GIE3_MYCRO|nr:hypothetical protein B0H17DRAFT_1202291 [Mycena rosella]